MGSAGFEPAIATAPGWYSSTGESCVPKPSWTTTPLIEHEFPAIVNNCCTSTLSVRSLVQFENFLRVDKYLAPRSVKCYSYIIKAYLKRDKEHTQDSIRELRLLSSVPE